MTHTRSPLPVIPCLGSNSLHVASPTPRHPVRGTTSVRAAGFSTPPPRIMPDFTVPRHFAMNVLVGVQTPTGGIFMLGLPLPLIPCAVQHSSCCAADTGSCNLLRCLRASDPGSAPHHSVSPRSRSRAPRRFCFAPVALTRSSPLEWCCRASGMMGWMSKE